MILSASRRTDIPCYYSDWFFHRIADGHVYVRNPMNIHQVSKINISPDVVDCIVFWTKNPQPMLHLIDELRNYKYYFQFTLTGYGYEIEKNIPNKKEVMIPIFKNLSNIIGKERVIWRYDPILINQNYTTEYHIKAFESIAKELNGYTEKVVISFIDMYTKISNNMKMLGIYPIQHNDMLILAKELKKISDSYNLTIETCAEQIDLEKYGIAHGHCIDQNLIEKIIGCRISGTKDKNQRQECGCYESIDIGAYNTCKNGCNYCYANYSSDIVTKTALCYDPLSPILCSNILPDDKISERKVESHKLSQISIFDY
ncbi:DUF1848 domain-containing protein [Anaeromicropila herbilytica]|uniref:DUF1848 domain-containing protein n=1 Tax=Anaeromicropila herbilytica TaxID=2785025 RepID=A0A7R7EPL2_9FIRM|nr:DUF1848 domain-containing protein [Anaeromicropila herbilytica]BCN32594.1 hypothetical protein bsdtb5_38890 [Anaeromicropila herbilytica]